MNHGNRHDDGRRIPGGRARIQRGVLALVTLATCTVAHAGVVDIDGGRSWNGWTTVGNSRTAGVWMSGSTTRNYTIYSAAFTLESNQTVGGTRVADGAAGDGMSYTGDTQASLFDGSWRAGDRIVGVGLRYNDASVLRSFYFMVDWAGDSMRAASTVGATDGGYGANTGDISIASPATLDAERFRAKQYSIANGVIGSGGTSVTPYGTNATTASPARGFALLANGSTNAAVGAQFFINLDAIARSNGGAGFGEGLLGPQTKLGLTEAESGFLFTQQTFPVPAPGALMLAGLTMLAPTRARVRHRR